MLLFMSGAAEIWLISAGSHVSSRKASKRIPRNQQTPEGQAKGGSPAAGGLESADQSGFHRANDNLGLENHREPTVIVGEPDEHVAFPVEDTFRLE